MENFMIALLWPISGLVGGAFFLLVNAAPIDKITLRHIVYGIAGTFMVMAFGPISFMAGISFWWDEYKIGEITLWERKADKVDRLQKQAKKMGFKLKEIDEN